MLSFASQERSGKALRISMLGGISFVANDQAEQALKEEKSLRKKEKKRLRRVCITWQACICIFALPPITKHALKMD